MKPKDLKKGMIVTLLEPSDLWSDYLKGKDPYKDYSRNKFHMDFPYTGVITAIGKDKSGYTINVNGYGFDLDDLLENDKIIIGRFEPEFQFEY